MEDLVSIIITTYKRNHLLSRAVRSVLDQTYSNVEVVIVDDNDPNSDYRRSTEALVKEKFSIRQNVKYIKMDKNSGACAARNAGVKAADGEYIGFLDDDDELLSEKIAAQVSIFDANPQLAVVGCFAEIVDENGKILSYEKTVAKGNVFFEQLCHNLTTTSLALIKKEVYLQSGGFEQMHSSQEHWMFAKIYSINPYFDYVPNVLVRLYHHSGERISTNKNKPLGAIELSEKIKAFYPSLTKQQIAVLEGFMNENIIYAFLNVGDLKSARGYYSNYKSNRAVSASNRIKVGIMCAIGIEKYRKLLHIKQALSK